MCFLLGKNQRFKYYLYALYAWKGQVIQLKTTKFNGLCSWYGTQHKVYNVRTITTRRQLQLCISYFCIKLQPVRGNYWIQSTVMKITPITCVTCLQIAWNSVVKASDAEERTQFPSVAGLHKIHFTIFKTISDSLHFLTLTSSFS